MENRKEEYGFVIFSVRRMKKITVEDLSTWEINLNRKPAFLSQFLV